MCAFLDIDNSPDTLRMNADLRSQCHLQDCFRSFSAPIHSSSSDVRRNERSSRYFLPGLFKFEEGQIDGAVNLCRLYRDRHAQRLTGFLNKMEVNRN